MSRFTYEKENTNEISFPLGGIGAGCIGLAGNGRLVDWEIFNRPNKGSLNGMSHFAIKAERDGNLIDARILQGDLHPPYNGEKERSEFRNNGFGWGPKRGNLCGMPHFREHTFYGHFPKALIEFSGEKMPGNVSLSAWSPFIPGNDEDSSLPAAFFEINIMNTTEKAIDYTVAGVLSNPFGQGNALNKLTRNENLYQLTMSNSNIAPDSYKYGDLTISTDADDVSYQEYWYRGTWCDDLEIYWQDFISQHKFENRTYTDGMQNGFNIFDTCLLAAHIKVKPGEKRSIKFVITWNVPNCYNYLRDSEEYANRIKKEGFKNSWKNWYATKWKDSIVSGIYALKKYSYLKHNTDLFKESLFSSTMPEVVLDAISANLSTLKSPTCLRLEDGTFYGWEGTGCTGGCCEGSCTHVWNYAQALPFLFPKLERSMRTANYKYNIDESGGSHFRIMLPLGIRADENDFRPCADGQFGDVIKTYRDWKISGDTIWLKSLWSSIKKTIEYAWSDDNPDKWDPEKTGVLWGRQHHTLDMELFGPNAWLTGYYLAALKAVSEMAPICGDIEFGKQCLALFKKGKAWTDEKLFNGEYYHQLIDLDNRDILKQFDSGSHSMSGGKASDSYWSNEHKEIKYQIGDGCEIDMIIAQWHANLYGLGEIYNPEQVKIALAATYNNNFKKTLRDVANPWRNYALNDEAGMQICTWPHKVRIPRIPLPYAQEDQGGYTYAVAIQMIQAGLVDFGLNVINAVRDRYDGKKRNPWNEIECGSNYARAMASYALLLTYSGFEYDMTKKMIGFNPINTESDCSYFWALETGWGSISFNRSNIILQVFYGSIDIKMFKSRYTENIKEVFVDGNTVDFIRKENNFVDLKESVKIKNSLNLKIS